MSVYYPYLRAKKFDVIAAGRVAAAMAATGKIEPIFEPVKTDTAPLIKRAETFASEGLPVGLVMNPKVGDLVGRPTETTTLLAKMREAGATVTPVLIVDEETQSADRKAFAKHVLTGEASLHVHMGVPTQSTVAASAGGASKITHLFIEGMTGSVHEKAFVPRSLIRDGFKSQIKNALYPALSFFSDLHLTYKQLGFSGFGDFLTIGRAYTDGGGPAYAVAIHLTEETPKGIVCRHFLSTSNATSANTPGKFGEAVAALAAYCKKYPGKLDFSAACKELLLAHAQGTFPGLPALKRISIQHHLELMSGLL